MLATAVAVLAVPSLPSMAREEEPSTIQHRDYVARFVASLQPLPEGERRRRLLENGPGKLAARAWTYSRVGRVAGDAGFQELGDANLVALLDVLASAPGQLWDDFHVITPAALTIQDARRAGRWTDRNETRFRPAAFAAAESYLAGRPMTHGNRDVSKIAGIATISTLYPDDELWDRVRVRVNGSLDRLLALGDLDENAGNYSSLGLLRFLHALRAMEREAELRTPGWRAVFSRYRDLVSPAGRMPEWGDDYFKVDPQMHWMYLFEFAAVLWSDPTFAAVARKMFQVRRPEAKFEEADLARSVDLLDLELLSFEPDAVEWPEPSMITWRTTAAGDRVMDKLILRSSREPGAAMVMMDLYCRGDHTHLDKLGAITFHESDHVPHFTNYGRYRQSAAHANLVLAEPAGNPFPGGVWNRGEWITQSLPTDRLPAPDDDPTLRTLPTMSLRAHPSKHGERFWLDEVRLEGPAGVLRVESFDELRWRPDGDVALSEIGPNAPALQIELDTLHYHGPSYDLVFDPAQYSHLRYEARFDGPRVPRVQARFPGGYDTWHFIGQTTLLARVAGARIERHEGGSRAWVTLDPYLEPDSRLHRHVMLLPDGTLLVRDDLDVGGRLDGHIGGVLWQLYNVDQRGPQWFHSRANQAYRSPIDGQEHRRDQLVRFAADRLPEEVACGLRSIPGGKGGSTLGGSTDLHSVHVSMPLVAGKTATFVTVVRPFPSDQDPAAVAAEIQIEFESGEARVKVGDAVLVLAAP